MRALLAGIFVMGCLMAFVMAMSSSYPGEHWPWWSNAAGIAVLVTSLVAALFLFNRAGMRPVMGRSHEQIMAELREKDLVVSASFHARRAFQQEEFEDEGVHYYLELTDGRTLYLNGQYLYEWEPIDDDPELNQPRKFPCTEFTVLRHRTAGHVVDILCAGEVLEPEGTAPHFSRAAGDREIPEDGDIITNRSYEEIKRARFRN